MAPDPAAYRILGVPLEASDAEIKAAFKAKARTAHPDACPDDPKAAENFRKIQEAYDQIRERRRLDDEQKRRRAAPPPPPRQPKKKNKDIFDKIFEEKRQAARYGKSPYNRSASQTGDVRGVMRVPFEAMVKGGSQRLEVCYKGESPRPLKVVLPAGIEDGERFRIEGKIVTAQILPHPYLRREGDDVLLELRATAAELGLGARVRVPTVDGLVELTIPPKTDSGKRLRLKKKGVGGRGDQYCVVKLAAPDASARAVEAALRALDEVDRRSPRPWEAGQSTSVASSKKR